MKLFSGRAFIVILAVCQGLGLIIGKILLLTGALVSQKLTTYPSLVTLPVALIMVGAVLCIFWIPHISHKIGIKTSHLLSCVIGIIGTALSAYATIIHSFWLPISGEKVFGVTTKITAQSHDKNCWFLIPKKSCRLVKKT